MAEDGPSIDPEAKPDAVDASALLEMQGFARQQLEPQPPLKGISAEVGEALQKLLQGKTLAAILGIVFLWSAHWDVHGILRGLYLAIMAGIAALFP